MLFDFNVLDFAQIKKNVALRFYILKSLCSQKHIWYAHALKMVSKNIILISLR